LPSTIHIQKIAEYDGHTGAIYALALDEVRHIMYTSGDDGIVVAWNLKDDGHKGKGILRLQEGVYALAFVPHSDMLLVGTSAGNVYMVDIINQVIGHTYRLNQQAIYNLHYHLPTQSVWVLHGKGDLSILDLEHLQVQKLLKLSHQHLRSICGDANKEYVWIGSSDHRILLLKASSGKLVHQWQAHRNSVFTLNTDPTGKYLISGGRDAYLRIWDLQDNYKEIRAIPAHNFTINDLVFSPTNDHFVTASRDKTIKIWDAGSFELLKVIDLARNESHTHSVNRIRWLDDGSIISCSDDRKAMRWTISWQ